MFRKCLAGTTKDANYAFVTYASLRAMYQD